MFVVEVETGHLNIQFSDGAINQDTGNNFSTSLELYCDRNDDKRVEDAHLNNDVY